MKIVLVALTMFCFVACSKNDSKESSENSAVEATTKPQDEGVSPSEDQGKTTSAMSETKRRCLISSNDNAVEMLPFNFPPVHSFVLNFFVRENESSQIEIVPFLTQEAVADYYAGAKNSLSEKSRLRETMESYAPESILKWYSSRVYQNAMVPFFKGALTATSINYTEDELTLFISDSHQNDGTPHSGNRPLGVITTDWKELKQLRVMVPYLKLDRSWGRTPVTIQCSETSRVD